MADAYASMDASPKRMKMPPKKLEGIMLKPGENGGAVAEHRFTHYEHAPEAHVFGSGEGKKLMAHLTEHLGMKMGKMDADGDND